MIQPYAFDNANAEGDKEAVILPNPPTLVNKLSANETNGIKDKLNEVIENINPDLGPVPFLDLRVKLKGSFAGVPNEGPDLEIGDVVHGFADADTIWTNAVYIGGDPSLRASYENQGPAPRPPAQIETYSGDNTFIIPDGKIVNSVLLVRTLLWDDVEWTQVADLLTITKTMNPGNRIQINFY